MARCLRNGGVDISILTAGDSWACPTCALLHDGMVAGMVAGPHAGMAATRDRFAREVGELWTAERTCGDAHAEGTEGDQYRRVRWTGVLNRGVLYLCASERAGRRTFWQSLSQQLHQRSGIHLDSSSTVGVSQHLAQDDDQQLFGFCIIRKRNLRTGDSGEKSVFWCSSQAEREGWITSLVASIRENHPSPADRPPGTTELVAELVSISHSRDETGFAISTRDAVSYLTPAKLEDDFPQSPLDCQCILAAAQVCLGNGGEKD